MTPDTSLREVRKAGVLRVCMPPLYPPLVTENPESPGIDVEIVQAIAKRLDVRLAIARNPAIGRDFNPRNWNLTRGQCEVLAGGVIASPTTRSFMETSTPYAETGWALVMAKPISDLQGRRVGVLPAVSGLDRLALSRVLRAQKAEVVILPDASEFAAALRNGRVDVGVTEKLLADQIAAREGFATEWASAELPRFQIALGLWKGDLTLKRAVADTLTALKRDGQLDRILSRYTGSGAERRADRDVKIRSTQ